MLKKNNLWVFPLFAGLIFFCSQSFALKFQLPPKGDDLFGEVQFGQVFEGDDFAKIARRYDVGFFELVEANPEVNPDQPVPGTVVIVPREYLLPHVPRKGIIINLATMRLYYFPKNKNYFYTYPIGIGRRNWMSPLGALHIIQKIKNPVWVVPDSIMKYRREHGDPVPKVVQFGPMNPLGYYALRLSKPTYLIHGTNEPSSVGRRSSAGCIHLYPEDVKQLFGMVSKGEPVLVINQPYVAGTMNHKLYIEAHLPLVEEREALSNTSVVVVALINSLLESDQGSQIDWQKADEIVREHMGIPTQVGEVQPPLQQAQNRKKPEA